MCGGVLRERAGHRPGDRDRNGQFEGMHGLGLVRCATGDPGQALAEHRAAHQLALELGQPVDQARALHGMGRAHRDLGEPEQARRCWQQSLAMLERLGVGEVEEASVHDLRANLVGSTDPDPASQEASGNEPGGERQWDGWVGPRSPRRYGNGCGCGSTGRWSWS